MKFLYSAKGCSHCDSRPDCPRELKNSDANLLKTPRIVKERQKLRMRTLEWITYCADFFRSGG